MSRQFVWFAAHTAIEPGHVECIVCLLLLTDGCASRVWTKVVTDVVGPWPRRLFGGRVGRSLGENSHWDAMWVDDTA